MNADPPAALPQEPGPDVPATPTITPERPSPTQRVVALLEVVLCSDYPTQAALGATFAALGYTPYAAGHLRVSFVVTLSLVDSALLVALMLFFMHAHDERPDEMFFGSRSVSAEASLGIPYTFVALVLGVGILTMIQRYAPSLHTVEHNPLQDLIRTPRDAWMFAVVVVVAGGVREELQRAFLLRRFEKWLGGASVGVVVTSIAFGAGHLLQGVDAAVTTGILGAFWGVIYLRRRSSVAPVVSHSGFNLLQIAQIMMPGR